jgi:hypothetical protein
MRSAVAGLSLLQLVVMLAVNVKLSERPELFVLAVRVTASDAAAAAVNGTAVTLAAPDSEILIDSGGSQLTVYPVAPRVLFMLPALLGALHGFSSARLTEGGVVALDAPYGEHGVPECLGWEMGFWCFVWAQHALVQCVMCSPLDAVTLLAASFVMTLLILAFCTLSVNTEGGSPSRRLEFPAVLLLCVMYMLMTVQTQSDSDKALATWTMHVVMNLVLVFGHIAEHGVAFATVVNCRCWYTLSACSLNVLLYALY